MCPCRHLLPRAAARGRPWQRQPGVLFPPRQTRARVKTPPAHTGGAGASCWPGAVLRRASYRSYQPSGGLRSMKFTGAVQQKAPPVVVPVAFAFLCRWPAKPFQARCIKNSGERGPFTRLAAAPWRVARGHAVRPTHAARETKTPGRNHPLPGVDFLRVRSHVSAPARAVPNSSILTPHAWQVATMTYCCPQRYAVSLGPMAPHFGTQSSVALGAWLGYALWKTVWAPNGR
jgi:hypothetical protein